MPPAPYPAVVALLDSISQQADELQDALQAFGLGVTTGIDELEAHMVATSEVVELQTEHKFTPGLYTRVCHIPAGVMSTTKIHNTTHPLFLMQGSASVWTAEKGWATLHAPCAVETTPNTRRIFFAHTYTIAVTCHPNPEDETDLKKIEDRIMLKHHNTLLS